MSSLYDASGIRKDSADSDQYAQTPDYIYDSLDSEFRFDFDPCPVKPKCDGLKIGWGKRNYVNPPYNDLSSWLEKAVHEMSKGNTSVFLIPFRPHREYFARLVLRQASEIRFFQEAITFKGYDKPSFLGVCLIIFRPRQAQVMGNFSLLEVPPSVTIQKLVNIAEEKFGVRFDYVKRKATESTLNASWGKVSFVSLNSHVSTALDRCEEEQRKGNTVVCLIPLRAVNSKFFAKRVMLGKPRGVYALSRSIVCEGYSKPNSDGHLMLLYRPGPKIRSIGPKISASNVLRS